MSDLPPFCDEEPLDPTGLATLMDVVAALRAWRHHPVNVAFRGADGGHLVSFTAVLDTIEVDEEAVRLSFAGGDSAVTLYGDMCTDIPRIDAGCEYFEIPYDRGDIIFHRR